MRVWNVTLNRLLKSKVFRWINLPVWENFWETQLFWKPRFRLRTFIFTTTIAISPFPVDCCWVPPIFIQTACNCCWLLTACSTQNTKVGHGAQPPFLLVLDGPGVHIISSYKYMLSSPCQKNISLWIWTVIACSFFWFVQKNACQNHSSSWVIAASPSPRCKHVHFIHCIESESMACVFTMRNRKTTLLSCIHLNINFCNYYCGCYFMTFCDIKPSNTILTSLGHWSWCPHTNDKWRYGPELFVFFESLLLHEMVIIHPESIIGISVQCLWLEGKRKVLWRMRGGLEISHDKLSICVICIARTPPDMLFTTKAIYVQSQLTLRVMFHSTIM